MPSQVRRQPDRLLLAFLFFLSGASALLFQVVWMRNLSLVLGVTTYASSAVISAYMAGLTLGSFWFGRLVDRSKHPWFLLGLMEIGIGLFAFSFPAILEILKGLYIQLWPAVPGHLSLSLIRLAFAVALLIVPTSLMGGTFPVVMSVYSAKERLSGGDTGRMYTVNNLGAMVGAAAAGFVLMERVGVKNTAWIGASISIFVGMVCLLRAFLHGETTTGDRVQTGLPAAAPSIAGKAGMPGSLKIALWIFGLQGFASMAFELLWIRLLVVFIGNNVYVFSSILTITLLGLTAGSYRMTRRLPRLADPLAALAKLQYGIGLSAAASILLLGGFMFFQYFGYFILGPTAGGRIIGYFLPSLLIVFFPSFCTGATLPLIAAMYKGIDIGTGRKMAVIASLDTAGSILGAPIAAFVLLPLCGIKSGIVLIAGASLALGLAIHVFIAAGQKKKRPLLLAAIALIAFAALTLIVNPRRPLIRDAGPMQVSLPLDDSPANNAEDWKPAVKAAFTPKLNSYCEGLEAIVSVVEAGGDKGMAIDGVVCSDDSLRDRPSHTMIAHLPLLLAPQAHDMLLIGLGIGFTTLAARQYGVNVDIAELEACELSVARPSTGSPTDILSDPQVRVRIDDGRNYVLATDRKYDVIQPGIIHPVFSSGNASFYTLDFYEECKRILRPGGIVSQWLPLFGMTEADFKMLVRTFQAAFPHTTIWYKWTDDSIVLLGTQEKLRIDWPSFVQRAELPPVQADLAVSHAAGVYSLLDSFFMDEDTVRAYTGDGPLHTDDHPLLEFSSARLFQFTSYFALRGMAPFRQSGYPAINGLGDADAEVRRELTRWFSATQEVIAGQIIEARLQLENSKDLYRDTPEHREALRHYAAALAINPADDNARFHYSLLRANILLAQALASLRSGNLDLAWQQLKIAKQSGTKWKPSYLAGAILDGLSKK
ncbi:MAG: fused MFS/spermidine synthase [Myxococcales bacterium]|nr:fused MFS/spermidine synthase [Myxococcales bacterium]